MVQSFGFGLETWTKLNNIFLSEVGKSTNISFREVGTEKYIHTNRTTLIRGLEMISLKLGTEVLIELDQLRIVEK